MKITKVVAFIMIPLFLWAAYVQFNDPDPWLWVSVYLGLAVASGLFLSGKLSWKLGVLLMAALLTGAVWAWPVKFEGVTIGTGDIHNIEEGRESLGLLISAIIIGWFTFQVYRKERQLDIQVKGGS